MDRAPFNRFHLLAAVCLLGGAVLDGYVLGIIGATIGPASEELGLNALGEGLVAASALIGVFLGGMLLGNLPDRLGRRRVFFWNIFAFVVLSLLQLFAVGTWDLVAYRVLLGVAIGLEYAVSSAMLGELSPRKNRTVLLGSFNAVWFVGFVAAFLLGNALEGEPWRILLASSAVIAVVILVLRMRLPESPMWLAEQGRLDEAQAIVDQHIGTAYFVPDPRQLGEVREMSSQGNESRGVAGLFARGNASRTIYACVFWFCQVAPLFAILTFIVPLLNELGFEGGFVIDSALNSLQILGVILGLVFLQLLTRRAFVISTFALMALGLLILGVFPSAPPIILFIAFGVFVLIVSGASNIQMVYPAEIFPTHVRSTGTGVAAAVSRISAAFATFGLPVLIDTLGATNTMLIFAAFPILGLVCSIWMAPETKFISLK